MKEREALKLALEALTATMSTHGFRDAIEEAQDKAITAIKEALAQPEQDTCKGCNGIGVVGNILDTNICPFCNGSGIEAQPEQEPVAYLYHDANSLEELLEAERKCLNMHSVLISIRRREAYRNETPLYTTPPQRTWVGLTDEELAKFSDAKLGSYDLCLEVEAKLKEKNHD